MSLRLIQSTVVVAAHRFNPSIVRDHWLIQHGIVGTADEIEPGYVITDVVVQIAVREFACSSRRESKPNFSNRLSRKELGQLYVRCPTHHTKA